MADRELQGMPGRPRQVRQETRDPARRFLEFSDGTTEGLGAGRRARVGELAQVLAGRVVRRAPLLQVAREQGLQDAHPGAALEVPRLHRVRAMPGNAPETRRAAVEARGQVDPRADPPPHRKGQGLFRRAQPARSPGRSHRPPARRDPHAPGLPLRRGPGLSHARPAVAHAFGRRGPAHQPHHRARHLAREYAVRARRAVDRPASARHGTRHRRDEAAARRRQHAGGGRARPADHVRRRPHPRHGARTGRARRRDRVLRRAREAQVRNLADRRIPVGPQGRRRSPSRPCLPGLFSR